jgi:hypothetical protein
MVIEEQLDRVRVLSDEEVTLALERIVRPDINLNLKAATIAQIVCYDPTICRHIKVRDYARMPDPDYNRALLVGWFDVVDEEKRRSEDRNVARTAPSNGDHGSSSVHSWYQRTTSLRNPADRTYH